MKKILKKIYFLFLLLSLFSFSACVKDTSLYLSQNKKEVNVDDYDKDGTGPGAVEGELTPGVQLVKLKVTYNGKETERRFKYFMPVSIVKSKPISLIFNFHGSYGTGSDPIAGVSMSDPLAQLAIRENCIIVFPAGEDTGAAVNWQNSDYHFPFVDAMVNYFKTHTPLADENRIYTCGQSSGAIFSFVLAYYRSEVFAAAVPVSGQMKLAESNLPARAVPIRAFNGKNDDIVIHW
ncbi:MAG: alpha/beta hydrolase family esterase [Sphingobacterium sp.]